MKIMADKKRHITAAKHALIQHPIMYKHVMGQRDVLKSQWFATTDHFLRINAKQNHEDMDENHGWKKTTDHRR